MLLSPHVGAYLMLRAMQQQGQQMQRTRQQTSDSRHSAATTMPMMMAILIQCFWLGDSELEIVFSTCDWMLAGVCAASRKVKKCRQLRS